MKILIVNTFDVIGGAAKAAYRIWNGLVKKNIEAQYFVMKKSVNDDKIIINDVFFQRLRNLIVGTIELVPSQIIYKKPFSMQWTPDGLLKYINNSDADVINLHWINAGFLNIKTIGKIKKPIVWTLHDMWPFTGGCHYSYECTKYENVCGNCPYLNSRHKYDLSYFTYLRKRKYWRNNKFYIITPSNWIKEKAKKSFLFKNAKFLTINNGVDTSVFKPINKIEARNILRLPKEKKLILLIISSLKSDERKGSNFIGKLSKAIDEYINNYKFIVVGMNRPIDMDINLNNFIFLGKLNDDYSMALVYSAVDVFVLMSKADNLPNTIAEALACGTPVVTFPVGGIPEMIEHKINGFLAKSFTVEEICEGIKFLFDNKPVFGKSFNENARKSAKEKYNISTNVEKYIEVFEKVMNDKQLYS